MGSGRSHVACRRRRARSRHPARMGFVGPVSGTRIRRAGQRLRPPGRRRRRLREAPPRQGRRADGAGPGAGDRRVRADRGGARAHLQLRPAAPCRRSERRRDRPVLPERHRAHQRDQRRGAVLHPRDQPHGRRRYRASARRRRSRPLRGVDPQHPAVPATISSATISSACCTTRRSPGAAPGCGCSTKPARRCASTSTARSSPARKRSTCCRTGTRRCAAPRPGSSAGCSATTSACSR